MLLPNTQPLPPDRQHFTAQFVATLMLLGTTLIFSTWSHFRGTEDLAQPLNSIPSQIAGWRFESDEPIDPDVLATLAATSFVSRTYEKKGHRLNLFVAYYASQKGGGALHSPNNCLPGNGWEIQQTDTAQLHVDGQPIGVNYYSIRNQQTNLALLYWYQSKNRLFTNEYVGKVLLFRDALLEGRRSGSLVRIIVPQNAEAVQEALSFGNELVKSLRVCFGTGSPPNTADGRTLRFQADVPEL